MKRICIRCLNEVTARQRRDGYTERCYCRECRDYTIHLWRPLTFTVKGFNKVEAAGTAKFLVPNPA